MKTNIAKLSAWIAIIMPIIAFSNAYCIEIVPVTARAAIEFENKAVSIEPNNSLSNDFSYNLDAMDAPFNDSCSQAEPITGPYPVSGIGTTIESTIDCPMLLNWEGVWYMIKLPYAYNDLTITICGLTEDLLDGGIVIMDDCNCDDMIGASSFIFLEQSECSTGFTGIELGFDAISSDINADSLVYWPAFVVNNDGLPMDFAYYIDVQEADPPPMGDICDDPIIIPSLPYSDTSNSCDFNNDYNFSGNDIIYAMTLDNCAIVDITLCNTSPVFDTYLLLYNQSSCGAVPINTDDDACMPPGEYGTSRIIDTLESGMYYICVDAYAGECGEYILDITTSPCPVYGACCVETECLATTLESTCDSLSGSWYANEACSLGFMCPGSCYEYLTADVNMAAGSWPPIVIGSDVTYLVGYFRGSESSVDCRLGDYWGSADANGDCMIIGSDVTYLVNYFRALNPLNYCPDYLPCWQNTDDLPGSTPPDWPNCE